MSGLALALLALSILAFALAIRTVLNTRRWIKEQEMAAGTRRRQAIERCVERHPDECPTPRDGICEGRTS